MHELDDGRCVATESILCGHNADQTENLSDCHCIAALPSILKNEVEMMLHYLLISKVNTVAVRISSLSTLN